jgi:hypothetical protein
MERRKFLIGMGSLTAAGAATLGTGAFTSVEADRSVDVEVAGDSSAYLALRKAADENSDPGANSEAYVNVNNEEVSFDFSSSNGDVGGDGFNVNAVTEVEDLLEVQNQGTQSAYLSVDLRGLDYTDGQGNFAYIGLAVRGGQNANTDLEENIAFDSSTGDGNVGGAVPSADTYELSVGEEVHLDLTVDTTDYMATDVATSGTITFIADQDSSP